MTVSANQSPAMGRVQEGLGKGENNNWGSVPIRWMVDWGGRYHHRAKGRPRQGDIRVPRATLDKGLQQQDQW